MKISKVLTYVLFLFLGTASVQTSFSQSTQYDLIMQELTKERPDDPVQYLAAYLIKHNPKKAADKKAKA